MDEIDEIVRASIGEAIDAEFARPERPEGELRPAFEAFTINFEAEPIAGLSSDNEDTEEEKNSSNVNEFCRICLCNDRKLSTISPQNRVAFQCVLQQDKETLDVTSVDRAALNLTTCSQMTLFPSDNTGYRFVCFKGRDQQGITQNHDNRNNETHDITVLAMMIHLYLAT